LKAQENRYSQYVRNAERNLLHPVSWVPGEACG
jgi:hypothetical protein